MTGEDDGYRGPAWLTIGAARLPVTVDLRGRFEPIDGRYHWYGRIARDERLAALVTGGRSAAVIETGHGACPCEIADPDLWDRYRVTGYSTPPFPVNSALDS
jgi:hypothetical protein